MPENEILAAIERLNDKVEAARTVAEQAKQMAHDTKGYQQQRIAAETLAARQPSPAPPPSDAPGWMKISGQMIAQVVGVLVILGTIGGVVMAPMLSRLSTLETKQTEMATAGLALGQRMQSMETQVATTRSTRDQQYEGLRDRVRGLELSDQTGTAQVNEMARIIAGILPRLEEILRRQERLENRLGGSRSGLGDEPARWAPAQRHI